jgi:post-segregation antitoxin (ccd killing protein)
MASTKISVTVDENVLREIRELAGGDINLSSIVDEGLRRQLQRMHMIALLDEMDARHPISARGREEGEQLWQRTVSSSTQARSRRSPAKKRRSA